ncbi:MAG TPA: sigma-70 family RNA polymerase sigma factor [Verrucomicrobiae bacterium]
MTTDSELLRHFARTNVEDAFGEIVRRHVNLVYSVALRQVNGDEHLAKDAAQTVFADLARKAAALSRHDNLAGWLYTSAYFAATKIARTENRRREREEKFMREPTSETAAETNWEQIRPALDDAMHELKEPDRQAILLRYFENRQFAEVGAKLGLNENAARMRVERALEKLRTVFAKHGITTTVALASVISANAVQIAPASLAATLTSVSVAGTGTGTFTLLKIMSMTQLKLAASVIIVAGAATAFVHQQQVQNNLRAGNSALAQQIAQLQNDNQSLSNQLADAGQSKSLSNDQMEELLKLRGEVGVLREQTNELGKLRQEAEGIQQHPATSPANGILVSPNDYFRIHQLDTVDALKYIALGMRMYQGDHNQLYPTNFDQLGTNYFNSFGSNNEVEFQGNIGMDTFEFMNAGLWNDQYPQMLSMRERVARQRPDGGWERVYAQVDGAVITQTSNDGNYDAWEQQHQQQFGPPVNQ